MIRTLHFAAWALLTVGIAQAGAPAVDAAVVFRSGSEVYDQAIAGIREILAASPYRIEYIDLAHQQPDLTASSPGLITAVGIGAWEQVKASSSTAQLLPALVLRQEVRSDATKTGAAYLDVSLLTVAENLKRLFPHKTRLAVIHRRTWPSPDPAVLARLRQLGVDLRMVECSGADKLLTTFASLKSQVDFVITLPDSELYNGATVKPLVMASLELQLPIVGFSAAFVRAGALAGIYPDFHELGRQTGEMMLRALDAKSPRGEEEPRKVVVAVNQRISRLIGQEPSDWKGILILK